MIRLSAEIVYVCYILCLFILKSVICFLNLHCVFAQPGDSNGSGSIQPMEWFAWFAWSTFEPWMRSRLYCYCIFVLTSVSIDLLMIFCFCKGIYRHASTYEELITDCMPSGNVEVKLTLSTIFLIKSRLCSISGNLMDRICENRDRTMAELGWHNTVFSPNPLHQNKKDPK